jgi:hypothetical protein
MPSRKQRRRRQKDRRHEYEYVYVDEEGHELGEEEVDANVARRNGAARTKEKERSTGSKPKRSGGQARAAGRAVEPPSWERVFKRGALLAPAMFVLIYLFDRKSGLGVVALVTAQMLVIFLPLSYLLDRMLYRRSLRTAESAPSAGRRRRS